MAEGLTQEALAERAGIDRKSISRIENGAFSPSLDRVWLIADALRVSVTDLVGTSAEIPTSVLRRRLAQQDRPAKPGR